jgi:Tfp pilus assembly protein PilN
VPSINMIAVRRADKRRQEQSIKRLVYTIAAEAGVTLVIVSVMAGRLALTNGQLSGLQDKLTKLQPIVTKIQQMQTQTQAMQPEVTTLAGARQDTLFWYNGFYEVASALPTQSWLTSLSTSGNTDGATPGTIAAADPQLSLNGVALNQDQVGTAILRMNQLSGLSSVYLSSVNQQKTGSTNTVSFQMTVHLTPEAASTDSTSQGGTASVQKS